MIVPLTVGTARAARGSTPGRQVIGGVVGNVLEWYDFAVFGYFAPTIGLQFFPSSDHIASLLNAFGVFAAGYLMRPLGGIVFGHIGDRLGRKRALQLSIAMMALPTTLLGLLPTHAQVGATAAFLLVLLRLIQGVSVGGELIGSISFVTESAPPQRRGLAGSFSFASSSGGILLGSAVATVLGEAMEPATLQAWGWRIPFLAGFLVGGVGLWMRRALTETAEFERAREAGELATSPVKEVVGSMSGRIVGVAALALVAGGAFYMLFVWWPTYLTHIVTPPVPHALLANTMCMAALLILMLVGGWLSDVVGRGLVLATYPLFVWTDRGTFGSALLAQLGFAILMGGALGPLPAAMVEMFPTRMRFSGVAVGYNIALALFGGTAPLICTWLAARTGDPAAPAYYLMAMLLVSLASASAWAPVSTTP